jgi:MFS transporter, FSR family, fosmidomycin resistance protein
MSERLDRRALAVLAAGHAAADLCQGAIPALIPFLIDRRGYSYAAAGALLLAVTVGSSIIQPAFGAVSDKLSLPWLMPFGVALSAVGIAGSALAPSFGLTAAAAGVGGLGVAAWHPEGARYANYASGSRRGTGMSIFSVGGNTGFALGPVLVTPAVLALGLGGAAVVAVLPVAVAILVAVELPRLHAHRTAGGHADAAAASGARDRWGPFTRLSGAVALRSGVYFGLQSFVPVWFVHRFGASEATGNAALTVMLAAGAVGTLAGGRMVDRVGPRVVLLGSIAAQVPLLVAFVLARGALAFALLGAIGFVTIMSFSVTVLMGQQYLPHRLGIASGVMLGTAIGVGGVAATLLGALADAAGLSAVMWTITALPVPTLALALSLPRGSRPARATRAAAGAAAGAASAPR